MKKVLVFDFYAPLGHFKMPYTTTSPLTFPVPPKTAVYGIIGAIIGLDKNEYLEYFQDKSLKTAIGINKKIKKTGISQNLINTKVVKMFARMNSRKNPPRTQIRIEFLKDVSYRIYLTWENKDLYEKLKNMLSFHKSVYSLSMGLSECLANYSYIGEFEAEEVTSNESYIELNSILPIDLLKDNHQIKILEKGKKFLRVHLPTEMKSNRELTGTRDFIVEENGKTILTSISNYWHIKSVKENIVFF